MQEFISAGITNVAVPLFFLFSGYLFFWNVSGTVSDFTSKFMKRVKSLLIPFLVWSLWAIAFCYMLQSLPQAKPFFSKGIISEYSFSEFMEVWLIRPIAYQLWFIQHLLIIITLSPLIFWLVKNFSLYILAPLVILWVYNFNLFYLSAEGLLFFSVGALIAIKMPHALLSRLPQYDLILSLSWLSVVLLKTYLFWISGNESLLIVVLGKCGILIGMLSVWSLYDRFWLHLSSSALTIPGMAGYSFFLFVSHEPILIIIKKLLIANIQAGSYTLLFVYILTALFTITICLTMGYYLKRLSPAFYDLITGGR